MAHTLKPGKYGAGDFHHYDQKAQALVHDNPNAGVFFASCWPTADALRKELTRQGLNTPIVFAGMVLHNNPPTTNSYGIRAFSIDDLCAYWAPLLKAVAPSMTTAAIVYDSFRDAPQSQRTVVANNAAGLTTLVPIPANDSNGNKNHNIYSDILAATSAGDGLIVTGCTVTGLLREEIGEAAGKKNLVAICPERMYVERTNFNCLMSCGPNLLDLYTLAAMDTIPRVLNHEMPTYPPAPHGYEFVVNSAVAQILSSGHFINPIAGPVTVTVNGVNKTLTPILV
jgi:hypothetical protein